MKVWKRRQRLLAIALAIALLASLTLASASGLAVVEQELLLNGNFESGFAMVPGMGAVGSYWGAFTNGGSVKYGFYDDQWAPVVADGVHSQLIELNTVGFGGSEANRYAGIYQTVRVVRGASYQLKMQGLMREQNPWPNDETYRYRVQWGYTVDGSTDWTQVSNWVELPWDKIDDRTSPTGLQSFFTSFIAPSDQITLFIRVWKKWGTTQKEVDVNLDSISLWGAAVRYPGGVVKVPHVPHGVTVIPNPPAQSGVIVLPGQSAQAAPAATCGGSNLLVNGSFEGGFNNGVAWGWGAFTNGGQAGYGFYDEMWPPVISDGAHGQLIEINSKGLAVADPDRYAGIYQVINCLVPGATYQFSLSGLMREEAAHPDEDMYRYRVQWGYAPAGSYSNANDVTDWVELPWDEISLRTSPGAMLSYSAQFQAPSSSVVIAVRAWKKWGTAGRELDVNLDNIQVTACSGGPVVVDGHPIVVGGPVDGHPVVVPNECFVYTIKGGDTLSKIAAKYGDTIAGIAQRNHIANPNRIYRGQKITVCAP